MLLTWKDIGTTVLAIGVVAFSYLFLTGYKFPLITGFRGATLVLLALGIGMCALGTATNTAPNNPWIITSSILGGLSLILIIAGLITGTKVMFLATTGTLVVLWVIATLRHLTSS